MLKIRKYSNTLTLLIRPQTLQTQNLTKFKIKKKSKSSLITLRSPKHFSVGKLKSITLNYKFLWQQINLQNCHLSLYLGATNYLLKTLKLNKPFLSNLKGTTVRIKTKFTYCIVKKEI